MDPVGERKEGDSCGVSAAVVEKGGGGGGGGGVFNCLVWGLYMSQSQW